MNSIASIISGHITYATLVAAFHVLVAISSVIAIVALIAAARAFSRKVDAAAVAERETERDRVRVLARIGLTSSGEHHVPPDDDPLWLAGQRASELARRRNRRRAE